MNIIYISDTEFPSEKANSVNIIKMCEALAKYSHVLTLFAPQISKDRRSDDEIFNYYGIEPGFAIKRIRVPNLRGTLFIYSLLIFLFALKNRAIRSHSVVFGRSPFAISLLALLGFRVAIDVHGKIWEKGFFRKVCFKYMAGSPLVKFISFNTEELKLSFQHAFKTQKTLAAMPNGASLVDEDFNFSFMGNGGFKVGYLGSFHEGRGIDLILKLSEELPEVEFHLAGGPSTTVEKLKAEYRKNVFFYNHIPFKDTYAFRGGCDVLIAPYQSNVKVSSGENTSAYMSPIKIFEYMSSRKPLICSDFPVLRSILNDKNSILVPQNSIPEWKVAIERLKNPELRKSISSQAFQDFLNHYTWESRAKKIVDLLKD